MKEYMDDHHQINPLFKTGNGWYEEQAFRAINQGLGRCIRHNRDYGAVLLLDSRFQLADMRKNLSRWFRDNVSIESNKDQLLHQLQAFYANCEREFPSNRQSIKRERLIESEYFDKEVNENIPVSKQVDIENPQVNNKMEEEDDDEKERWIDEMIQISQELSSNECVLIPSTTTTVYGNSNLNSRSNSLVSTVVILVVLMML